MLLTLSNLIRGHHRRTLWLTLLFVLVAGVIGGPLAGSLKSSANNAPSSADSQQADRLLQTATGVQSAAGVVLLVHTPHGVKADTAHIHALVRRLDAVPGITGGKGRWRWPATAATRW